MQMQGDQVVPFLDQSIVVKMEVRWPQTQFMNPIPVYKNLYVIIISCGVVVVADILNMQSGNFDILYPNHYLTILGMDEYCSN